MSNLSDFTQRPRPGGVAHIGRAVRVEPLDWAVHGTALQGAICGAENAGLWEHIPIGPFKDLTDLQAVIDFVITHRDWATMVIVRNADNRALGMASYMRIRPEHGSAEIGCVVFGEALKRSREASEAMYLMARHVFDELAYRRYEWKCGNDNQASKRAAERLGFVFEGVFRNDMVMKGRNRDTAWYSVTDDEWPNMKAGFETWLADDNFDDNGMQLRSLSECRT